MTGPIVSLTKVCKRYGEGERSILAVRDVSLDIAQREFVSLMGPSGSGKSTLLNLIAGLDLPTEGSVRVQGQDVGQLSQLQLARLRRRTVTFIFQFFNLLPNLTARQNVAVPLRADGRPRAEIADRVERALAAVGLTNRADHYPSELAGGEMQRVAIARALATDAPVILADEPTGNLDSARSEEILDLLRRGADEAGRTVVMVTHNVRAAAIGDRLLTLEDGHIVDEVKVPSFEGKVVRLPP